MIKPLLLSVVMALSILPSFAKKKEQPPDPVWAGITARGRMLAEYDVAARRASDAVLVAFPAMGRSAEYVARKTDAGWIVAFGQFNNTHDKFLVAYLATQVATPLEFKATQNLPPQEDTGFYYLAARALETSKRDFQAGNRAYNIVALPAESNQMYVYIYPAQTRAGIYPLGGDFRFLISADGSTIVEKRQLHKTILEIGASQIPAGAAIAGGTHSHVLSDLPEDTDVYYVLTRRPSVPEYIGAGKHVFKIQVDGTIGLMK